MSFFTRTRKAASAAALAGAMLVSGGLATAAIAPSVTAGGSQSVTHSQAVKAEPAVFVSLLCQYYGRCSR
ncbi:hypothetical protein [Kocuria sp.]|uniref:hypothetical protein n=1 Tax=Kocuria sp. TaxID=1871328 RepID=UPI0026E0BF8B|nr:hypothetical protein [Kocuria sp.]MDO5617814.1 hypothetical protein [Kocuria sp.]